MGGAWVGHGWGVGGACVEHGWGMGGAWVGHGVRYLSRRTAVSTAHGRGRLLAQNARQAFRPHIPHNTKTTTAGQPFDSSTTLNALRCKFHLGERHQVCCEPAPCTVKTATMMLYAGTFGPKKTSGGTVRNTGDTSMRYLSWTAWALHDNYTLRIYASRLIWSLPHLIRRER